MDSNLRDMVRGSRKHVLDWAGTPRFLPDLLELAQPVECHVTATSKWRPLGYGDDSEARLETFGPAVMPGLSVWATLRSWWLKHEKGANTPNWDIALHCQVEGAPGLILVEAKANEPELSDAGKSRSKKPSEKSDENREQIGTAIGEARAALASQFPGICIDRDKSYQLSNRIAFAWKLASLGVHTVVIYLGFTGDSGISDVGRPFRDEQDWRDVFTKHLDVVCPSPIAERRIQVGPASFWILSRARPVIEISQPVI